MEINSIEDFREYIKLELGCPVIKVEVSDAQINLFISDVVQAVHRYLTGEGIVKEYMSFTCAAGVSAYDVPDEVAAISDFQGPNTGAGGINTLFSPTHLLLYDQMQSGLLYGSGQAGAVQQGGALQLNYWQIGQQTISDVEHLFKKRYRTTFSPMEKKLFIYPTPDQDGIAMITAWRKVDSVTLYNNYWVKKLAVAKTMMHWGRHLKKYSVTMPGGSTMNGSEIYQDGKIEYDESFAQMKREAFIPFFKVG